jgi:NADH-quinone oxidoreductase subunit J
MGFLSVAALFGVYKSSLDATYVKDVDSSQDIVVADEIDGFWSEHFEAATFVGESESFVTVGSTQALGKELFSSVNGFILPFEIVSILLLVAMIGVILLSKKDTK